uniref:Uncharacterized protein n=1 Tax=Arundo donax TaxID=35708 RepID=A0A0A9E4Q5_ARUDO
MTSDESITLVIFERRYNSYTEMLRFCLYNNITYRLSDTTIIDIAVVKLLKFICQ